jgi:bifunctional non-homologous end joining protein LigD
MRTFVVVKHEAKKAGLHRDLRLEMPSGKFRSFALRKGIPKGSERHLAVEVAEHNRKEALFKGKIKEGYGAGTLSIEDKGSYKLSKQNRDEIKFNLMGKRYHGEFVLIKFPKEPDRWLLLRTKQIDIGLSKKKQEKK